MKMHNTVTDRNTLPHDQYAINTDVFSVLVDPLDRETYKGQMEIAALGSLSLAKIRSAGAIVSRRFDENVNPDFNRYSFLFPIEGEMILSYHRGVIELKAGQFLFIDNAYPRSMFVQKSISLVIVSLPGMVLKRYFPEPADHEGIVLNTAQHGTSIQDQPYRLILDNWNKIRAGSMREFAPLITDRLLKQLADVYGRHVHHASNKKAERITQAKELIEERLSDTGLTIESLAEELEISSRYLRSLFAPTEKLSHYLLRRRLEESAQRLSSPEYSRVSVTQIAYGCGFTNIAHFCRTFKNHYQVTAREYRKAQLRHSIHCTAGE